MYESPEEIGHLLQILDRSALGAGPHLRNVITDERRVSARELCENLQGMRLLVVATATYDGRPLAGPVDGYFLHGSFYFTSSRDSVRMRHLVKRPAISATHLPGEAFAVTIHGSGELFEMSDPTGVLLRQAVLDHYLPKVGPDFETWLDSDPQLCARINAEKIFTFRLEDEI